MCEVSYKAALNQISARVEVESARNGGLLMIQWLQLAIVRIAADDVPDEMEHESYLQGLRDAGDRLHDMAQQATGPWCEAKLVLEILESLNNAAGMTEAEDLLEDGIAFMIVARSILAEAQQAGL